MSETEFDPISPTLEATEPVARLTKDLRKAAATLTSAEARFLVDNYYIMQKQRIRAANQVRSMGENKEPHTVLDWYTEQSDVLERAVRGALGVYSRNQALGEWAQSICGIGPVITSGLLAHIDVTKPTAGAIWRFAGLDPTVRWEKGKKRPWNASLKRLCWLIGESFVKVSTREADVYGKEYVGRKTYEQEKNARKEYAEQAKYILETKRIGKSTEAYGYYSQGLLPPAQIHMRAKRHAVKMFLSHYHAVGHYIALKRLPPRPWVIEHGGHSHIMRPPNMDLIDGMQEAWLVQNGN